MAENTFYTNGAYKEIFESIKKEYLNEVDRHSKLLFEAGGFCFLNILVWLSFIILGSTSEVGYVFRISSFCFLPITSKILGAILLTSILGLGISFFYFIEVFFQVRPFKAYTHFRMDDKEKGYAFTTVDYLRKESKVYAPHTFDFIFGRRLSELTEENIIINFKISRLLERGITFFSIFTLLYIASSTLLIFLQ